MGLKVVKIARAYAGPRSGAVGGFGGFRWVYYAPNPYQVESEVVVGTKVGDLHHSVTTFVAQGGGGRAPKSVKMH